MLKDGVDFIREREKGRERKKKEKIILYYIFLGRFNRDVYEINYLLFFSIPEK